MDDGPRAVADETAETVGNTAPECPLLRPLLGFGAKFRFPTSFGVNVIAATAAAVAIFLRTFSPGVRIAWNVT